MGPPYRQVPATKGVTSHQSTHGTQQVAFDTSGNTLVLPSMSYFRLRCKLTQSRSNDGAPLPPNVCLAGNLFKPLEVKLNGYIVELDNAGRATNIWVEGFDVHRAFVAVDGFGSRRTCLTPNYGPSRTQAQDVFDAAHKLRYSAVVRTRSEQRQSYPRSHGTPSW